MGRSAVLSAMAVGVCLLASAAVAQPAKVRPPKPIPAAEWVGKPLTFSFDKTPLKAAIGKLNVQCVLAVKAMEEEAISLETPISGKAEAGPALESLNAALLKNNLFAELQHDVIFIAPTESRSAVLTCRFYRLKPAVDLDDLVKQVTTKTAINSWDVGGGRGHIARIGSGVLAISQSPRIHHEIETKFGVKMMRVRTPVDRIAAIVPTKGMNPLTKISGTLRRPISAEFPETPLREMLPALAKTAKAKMALDEKALLAAAINVNTPVTVNLKEIPLESVLALMLRDLGLSWTIDDDQILITIPEVAEQRLIAIDYDVRDLLTGRDADSLLGAITRTIQRDSWSDVGGPGKITAVDGTLSVTHSVQKHREIEIWLADLRTALKLTPADK